MKSATISVLTIASLLAGCATTNPADNSVINRQVEQSQSEAQKLIAARSAPIVNSLVNYSDESWITIRKIEKSERDIANAKTDAVQIEINQNFTNLNDVASTITSITGLPVFVGSDTQGATQTLTPGATALTRTLGPNARASDLVMQLTAALLAA